MKPPLWSWRYERGFLTAIRGGDAYELGYFRSRAEARKVALSFLKAPGTGRDDRLASSVRSRSDRAED